MTNPIDAGGAAAVSTMPASAPLRVRRTNPIKEILRPLGQLLIFVLGSSIVMALITVALALILRPTRDDMDMLQITLILLPQVLIDGLVLGFMYATIALGYTMVYGVLEFINFAHGEIFMFGAFAGGGICRIVQPQ